MSLSQGGRLLIDSDVFVLLGGAGLIERSIELLGFDIDRTLRLYPLQPMLKKQKPFRNKYGDVFCDEALRLCERVESLTAAPQDEAAVSALLAIPGMGAGEAILYATVAEQDDWIVTSGDKRAMRSLQDPSVVTTRDRVAGRVVCLESALLGLVEADGVDSVAQALSPVRDGHQLLKIAFSDRAIVEPKVCQEALRSYIDDLAKECGAGFLHEV